MTTATEVPSVLFIEGELNIYRAAEIKDSLLGALVLSQSLEVDLAGVTELDSAGVQVLMLAKNTARSMQRELRLCAHSPVVVEVFELLNLASFFGDPLVIS